MPITEIHRNMKRRLISKNAEKGNYLHADHSALLEGTGWRQQQNCFAGTEGLTIVGNFNTPQIGTYIENVTQNFIAQIIATNGNELTMHYPLQTVGTNWSTTDGASAGKLIDSTATFTQTASVGMIVALHELDDHAIITAIDSDTQLSVSKDIFPTGIKYSIMKGFAEGDTIRLGTAILDGSAGQVMVEMPAFWYGHQFADHQWSIAAGPKDSLEPCPAFVKPNGGLFEAVYMGAFEACISGRGQTSEALTGYNLATEKLKSAAGFQPVTYGQRSEFRQAAQNNGPGFQIIDHYLDFAAKLLFLVEHESMNSQDALGDGVTNWSGSEWSDDYNYNNYYALSHNGFSIPSGNKSANVNTAGGVIGGYMSYRGIENFYGNLWKWIDGVNYLDQQVYLANDPGNYQDDISTDPYFDTGLVQPPSNGWQSKIHDSKHGLIVTEAAGNSNDGIGDYYWTNPSWRVARAGGSASTGVYAGFAALHASYSSSDRDASTGSRVCLKI